MKKWTRMMACVLASGFLAFLYPELLQTADTVICVESQEENQTYLGLLKAKPEEIACKSKLLEWWRKASKLEDKKNESGYLKDKWVR